LVRVRKNQDPPSEGRAEIDLAIEKVCLSLGVTSHSRVSRGAPPGAVGRLLTVSDLMALGEEKKKSRPASRGGFEKHLSAR